MIEKLCKRCDTLKPSSLFSVIKRTYKGKTYQYLQSYCKPCVVEKFSQWGTSSSYVNERKGRNSRLQEGQMKVMSGPMPWNYLRGKSTLNSYKVYPICEEGHRYVGPTCLKCKYSVPV